MQSLGKVVQHSQGKLPLMVRFLIHGRTLLSSLFKQIGTEESLDYALVLLRSDANINGYVSGRTIDIVERDIEYYSSSDIALRIIANIKSGFSVCHASPQAIDLARQFISTSFDTALEISCALEHRLDFILTQNVDDFRACGFPIMSMDDWLNQRWSAEMSPPSNGIAIVSGGLDSIQRLSEFCVAPKRPTPEKQPLPSLQSQNAANQILPLAQWRRNYAQNGWQSVKDVLGIALGHRQRDSRTKERAKVLSLDNGQNVALLISYGPKLNQAIEIEVSVSSKDLVSEIPGTVQLSVLDQWGRPTLQDTAENPRNIKLLFSGNKGEIFVVSVQIDSMSYVEKFMI